MRLPQRTSQETVTDWAMTHCCELNASNGTSGYDLITFQVPSDSLHSLHRPQTHSFAPYVYL